MIVHISTCLPFWTPLEIWGWGTSVQYIANLYFLNTWSRNWSRLVGWWVYGSHYSTAQSLPRWNALGIKKILAKWEFGACWPYTNQSKDKAQTNTPDVLFNIWLLMWMGKIYRIYNRYDIVMEFSECSHGDNVQRPLIVRDVYWAYTVASKQISRTKVFLSESIPSSYHSWAAYRVLELVQGSHSSLVKAAPAFKGWWPW